MMYFLELCNEPFSQEVYFYYIFCCLVVISLIFFIFFLFSNLGNIRNSLAKIVVSGLLVLVFLIGTFIYKGDADIYMNNLTVSRDHKHITENGQLSIEYYYNFYAKDMNICKNAKRNAKVEKIAKGFNSFLILYRVINLLGLISFRFCIFLGKRKIKHSDDMYLGDLEMLERRMYFYRYAWCFCLVSFILLTAYYFFVDIKIDTWFIGV